jgi:hypothetical protein
LFPHWLVAADTRFGKTVLAQRRTRCSSTTAAA